jgi:hypothetical protein
MVGDRMIVGFDPKELAEALHLEKVLYRDPSETIPLIERALEAVEQAVRQMPNEKMDWARAIPKRERSMRQFIYHIFRLVEYDMEELGAGVAPSMSDILVRSHSSSREIADYGRTVIERYRAWAPKLDLDALRKPSPEPRTHAPRITGRVSEPDDYHSRDVPKSGAERLDLLAGHTIQHLRQLYSLLEKFGVTPEPRVQDQEWPSAYVLRRLEVE